jgi:2'-5' RNA ligase
MRLFIAVELDDQARHAIAAEQARLTMSGHVDRSGLRWTRAEQLHPTLAFLGEVDDSRSQVVIETMRPPISGDRFAVVFGGLGVFPPAGAPRVLWLGLTTGARVTLARWRMSRESDRRCVLAAASHRVARQDVEGVALIRSRRSQAGAAYTALCHTPLGDSTGPPLQSG